ncbi:hypothetical protein DAT39_022131, partial [Clarias magur]
MKVYADLPELLGQNGEHAVPIKVWLYPLVKLNSSAAKLHRNIASELIRAVESVIEALNITDMKCDDLLEDTVAKTFSTFHDRVQDFQKFCSEYKQDFMKKLGSLLPEIRGGQSDISAMNELIEAHEKSPFNTKGLEQWITKKEKESMQVKALLKQLHELGAEVTDDVDKYLLDLDVEIVVAFAFTCLQYTDLLLGNQEIYLKNPSENTVGHVPQDKSWTSNELMCMKNNLKVFKELITSNKSQNTKFIVQNLPQTSNDDCSCILMYECSEAVRFVPPSKPKCPNLESVTDSSITVELSPPCAATLERKLLYKMKQETNWNEQPVNQDMVTLMDLKEGTDYEIKCGALGKLDYLVESDAITVKTKSLRDLVSTKGESTRKVTVDMGITKDNSQGHHDQRLQAVGPGTVERTTEKAKESDNVRHKRDQQQQSKSEQLQEEEQTLVEKMKKRVKKKQSEMKMEEEQVTELKRYFKMYKEIISAKDAEIARINEKLKNGDEVIQHKDTLLKDVYELLSEKETQLKKKETDLTENAQTMQMMSAALEKNETELEQAQTELNKTTKYLKDTEQHIEEKNTQLENMDKLLSEKETQLKNTDKELETSNNKLETLGQELQDKKRQLQEMMIVLEQQKTELIEKNKLLEEKERLERETQLMERDKQLQEEDKLLTENPQTLEHEGAQIKQGEGEDEDDALT